MQALTFLDMSGVVDGDVPSVLACDILPLPCIVVNDTLANQQGMGGGRRIDLQGWGQKLANSLPKVANKKESPTKSSLSTMETVEMERILREMDCYFYCKLGKEHPHQLTIMYPFDSLFAGGPKASLDACCQQVERQNQQYGKPIILDGHVMARRLQEVACRNHGHNQTKTELVE